MAPLRLIDKLTQTLPVMNGDGRLSGKGASESESLASVMDGLGPVLIGPGGALPSIFHVYRKTSFYAFCL